MLACSNNISADANTEGESKCPSRNRMLMGLGVCRELFSSLTIIGEDFWISVCGCLLSMEVPAKKDLEYRV